MTLFPVIGRELRSTARQTSTYYLRTLGVAASILVSLFFLLDNGLGPNQGGKLFARLHLTLFWAIWLLVPMLTADCLSRERREGTLGLLFLTMLDAKDVILAKGFTHGLRALTLWLAVLPVVTIPFLLGGASQTDAVLSLVINWSSICWAITAGLVASAWSRTWRQATIGAVILAVGSLLVLATITGGGLASMFSLGAIGASLPESWLLPGLFFLMNAGWGRAGILGGVGSTSQLFWVVGAMAVLSLFALGLGVRVAAARTRKSWQEEPRSPRLAKVEAALCTPVLWLSLFRRWMRYQLERNPIGWLEQRTWNGRLVVWAWLAVLISFYSAILTDRFFLRSSDGIHYLLSWLLAGSMAIGASGSFRRERETGVLELLLVSPLHERQIINGRLRGLWGQFLPTILLLLGMWLYLSTFWPIHGDLRAIWFFASTFFTVPIIGLFFSLQSRNFLSAFLATLTFTLFLPLFLPETFRLFWSLNTQSGLGFEWNLGPSLSGAVCQLLIAALTWERLHYRLKHRAFPLQRTD